MGPVVHSRFLYVSSDDLGRFLPVTADRAESAPVTGSALPERQQATRRPDSDRATARPARADRPASPVGWRLIGGNNRELGRSAATFDGLAACRAAVERLREGVSRAHVVLTMSDTQGTWTWRLELDGFEVAVSGRRYQRQREAQHNLSLFLAAVPQAQEAGGAVAHRPRLRGLRPFGPSGEGRNGTAPAASDPEDGEPRPLAVTRRT
jgi:hypothetical protein